MNAVPNHVSHLPLEGMTAIWQGVAKDHTERAECKQRKRTGRRVAFMVGMGGSRHGGTRQVMARQEVYLRIAQVGFEARGSALPAIFTGRGKDLTCSSIALHALNHFRKTRSIPSTAAGSALSPSLASRLCTSHRSSYSSVRANELRAKWSSLTPTGCWSASRRRQPSSPSCRATPRRTSSSARTTWSSVPASRCHSLMTV